MTLRILDPTLSAERAEAAPAKRVAGLDGKVLGLLSNSKVNGDHLLNLVGQQLAARYALGDVVVMTKGSASRVAEEDMLERLARDCDVIVTAIGD